MRPYLNSKYFCFLFLLNTRTFNHLHYIKPESMFGLIISQILLGPCILFLYLPVAWALKGDNCSNGSPGLGLKKWDVTIHMMGQENVIVTLLILFFLKKKVLIKLMVKNTTIILIFLYKRWIYYTIFLISYDYTTTRTTGEHQSITITTNGYN